MATDLGRKLDEVLERLTKLDVIENRLNNIFITMANIEGAISSLDKDVAELKVKFQTTFESVNKLEQSVEFNASDIADLKRDQLELKFENENLKKQLLYSESYSRRENLKFIGIVENTSDSTDNQNAAKSSDSLHSENTKDVLFKFLKMNLISLMQGKELNSKGSIVWANQEAVAILVRLLLVFSATRIEKKLCIKLERSWRAKIMRFLKTSPKNYTNLEKSSRTSLNAPGKRVLRPFSVRNFRTSCTLTVNLYH